MRIPLYLLSPLVGIVVLLIDSLYARYCLDNVADILGYPFAMFAPPILGFGIIMSVFHRFRYYSCSKISSWFWIIAGLFVALIGNILYLMFG